MLKLPDKAPKVSIGNLKISEMLVNWVDEQIAANTQGRYTRADVVTVALRQLKETVESASKTALNAQTYDRSVDLIDPVEPVETRSYAQIAEDAGLNHIQEVQVEPYLTPERLSQQPPMRPHTHPQPDAA